MSVSVFKTNVQTQSQAILVINVLIQYLPKYKINFDLEDCDKILRVEGNNIEEDFIVKKVSAQGFEVLSL